MRAKLLTLLALGACWPAWILAGRVAETLDPGGAVLLLRGLILLLLIGLIGRGLDRLHAWRSDDGAV
jgi:hypothetical protein